MSAPKRARSDAQRLITVIRDRAFDELARERGELTPMALTMDAGGRIGMIAVYTGDAFPDPDNHLVDLTAALRLQVARDDLDGAATAHRERVTFDAREPALDTVCVRYEARRARPLRIYFPYQIKKKLSGRSDITMLAPVTMDGTPGFFARPDE